MTNKTSSQDVSRGASRDRVTRRRWLGLFAILAATIMNLLDSNIVGVAAPAIRADLGGSYSTLQWLAAAYTLALAVGLLTGGRLGDMYGRRRMLLIGVGGFVLASLACAAAWSPESLVAFRVLQGLFGAVMIPQGFGLIRDLFPPQEMGKAFGTFGPIIGLSTIAGPVVAGLLTDNLGWRSVFAINLPLGLFAFIAGMAALPRSSGTRAIKLDGIGALTAGVGMFLVVYPLVQGRELGWPGWIFGMLAAAVALLASFVTYQVRRKRGGRTPLVELSVFAKRSYTSGVIFVLVFFGAIVGFSLAVGLYLQLGLGQSPIRAALTMSAWAVGAFVGSGFSATQAKVGRKLLHIGLSIMAVALAGLAVIFTGTPAGGWGLALPLFAYGLGMGMIFVPLFDIIMGDVAGHEVGSASAMLESLQQMGASLGVSILGTVFFTAVGARFTPLGAMHASHIVTLIALGLTAAAFGLGFLLPKRARSHAPAPADAPATEPASPEPALV
jgi:EmrB/QacA subfamily drug resistance transporter